MRHSATRPARKGALAPTLLCLLLFPVGPGAADVSPVPRPSGDTFPAADASGDVLPADPSPEPLPEPSPVPAAPEADRPDPEGSADLFAMPRLAGSVRVAFAMAAAGEVSTAIETLDRLVTAHPDAAVLRAQRAAFAMMAGDPETALVHLEAAAANGLAELPAVLADPVFASLAETAPPGSPELAARFQAIPAGAAPPSPSPAAEPVDGGTALLAGRNTRWNPESERLEPHFRFPPETTADVTPEPPRRDPARELLRDHWKADRAAGHLGDLYDNRDRGHSRLKRDLFPQLAHVAYSDAARKAEIDYGLNDSVLFPTITFGNSSTALTTGPQWRSLPRLALTRPDGTGPMRLWQNWAANHLYVHPGHKDWGSDHGDLFPANTPYLLVSRGSSGSDQPFLEAVASILAAFRPETKARLAKERLVVPTVQMVFRRSLQSIRSREDYLSGAAHPAVFERGAINLARMVSLANSLKPDAIPAEVRLTVEEEELGAEGIDFFGQGLSEQFFDTPSAVARIWRSRAHRRTMIVSAEGSRDPNGRPLSFDWRLLQGDPAKVRIEPLDGGARARITLDWHDPFEAHGQQTARVDIGVFARNGVHDSAPAFLSWYFPPHEARTYEAAPDGTRRLAVLDGTARADTYADPILLPRTDWRDQYLYAEDGTLLGWTRHREGRTDAFTAEGHRILQPPEAGRPGRAEVVQYAVAWRDGVLWLEELSSGQSVSFGP